MIRMVHHKNVASGIPKNESIQNSEITTGNLALVPLPGTLIKLL